MSSPYARLSRAQLAVLVPELLLAGQLIDRSGMAWCLAAFGREEMTRIAVEEWRASSPIYTRRMRRALDYEGDDVSTIFKGLQLDIGAPPQFMDFRFTVTDPRHGGFHLDQCGALLDVEPLGNDYVIGMCHHIEDPTFDATAAATNPKARVRPVHRPPRVPADRHPHCEWTVTIDEGNPDLPMPAEAAELMGTRAATLSLARIDPDDDGRTDYRGPLLADLDFTEFARSALVRIADEVCLQMHLLYLGFVRAVARRTDPGSARKLCTKQLVGIAGLAAQRIHRALNLPDGVPGALATLALHPLVNPSRYANVQIDDAVTVRTSPAHEDGAWIALCGPDDPAPLQAIVRAVDPHLDVEIAGTATDWSARVVRRDSPAAEASEVAVTRFSTGAAFAFQPRRSLPLIVRAVV